MSDRLKNYYVYIGNRSEEDCYKVKAKDVDEAIELAKQYYVEDEDNYYLTGVEEVDE
tara:strand:+ start:126 stop:296 length:171 start_codon:yes stop_codon:yes gene_type:complete